MIHTIEEGLNVRLDYPLHLTGVRQAIESADRIVGAPSGSEAIGTVQEVLLIYRFQYLADRPCTILSSRLDTPKGRVCPFALGM